MEDVVLMVLVDGVYYVVIFISFCYQLWDFFWWVLQVGVEGNNQIVGYMVEVGYDC